MSSCRKNSAILMNRQRGEDKCDSPVDPFRKGERTRGGFCLAADFSGPGGPLFLPPPGRDACRGAVEGTFICLGRLRLPFLPVRGPLTSALLLLANCDAADTLVMFLPLSKGHSRAPTPPLAWPYSASRGGQT